MLTQAGIRSEDVSPIFNPKHTELSDEHSRNQSGEIQLDVLFLTRKGIISKRPPRTGNT
jgi:hypothetical protein